MDHDFQQDETQMRTLSVRKTFGYVGTYRNLDQWEDVGMFCEVAKSPALCTDESDMCDPTRQEIFVRAVSDAGLTTVRQALENEYSAHGCSHEYDCCGCRSYHATAVYTGRAHWRITVTSSRNY